MNKSRRATRRRNLGQSDYLISAYVGIQALLEVVEENEIKLTGNSTGKVNLVTEAIVRASSKTTNKGTEQSQDEMRFKLKEAVAGLIQPLVHNGIEERRSPELQVTEISGKDASRVQNESMCVKEQISCLQVTVITVMICLCVTDPFFLSAV
jgi:hypothetical protein